MIDDNRMEWSGMSSSEVEFNHFMAFQFELKFGKEK